MRKFYLVFLIAIIILLKQPHYFKASQEDIDNKLLQDTLVTTLFPYIKEGVIQYYGYPKSFGLYDTKVIKVIRELDGAFGFTVEVIVNTFEHAHNPPYGKETMAFNISPMGIKKISFYHVGDEEEKKMLLFYKESISDIKQSFHLNLEHYSQFNYNQLYYQAEKKEDYRSLSAITETIVLNILNPEIHPPYKNIISPVTFINGNNGYILFKKADGTNMLFKVKKKNNAWNVVEKKSEKGKKMKNKLLWYM
ncbi:DUF3888 domain-containing protein [Psychrobacillus sp. NPDC058041]|uniref:DUF3888 domain-containing protein n=1 Tax=Psychrobacillus sp. NPDC058041 TaxID=3346310 RepID=UPI0036D9AEE8